MVDSKTGGLAIIAKPTPQAPMVVGIAVLEIPSQAPPGSSEVPRFDRKVMV